MGKTAYERYSEIRDKYGYKDSTVASETGITKSTFSDWKSGRYIPKNEKLSKIASFLNVSTEYLLTGDEPEGEHYYLNPDTAEMAQKIFDNRDLRVLFDAAQDATPEDLKTTYDMLMALKKKERDEDE